MAGRLSCAALADCVLNLSHAEQKKLGGDEYVDAGLIASARANSRADPCNDGKENNHASAPSISRIAKAASRLIAFRSGRYAARSCGTCVAPPGPLGSLASTSFRLTLATSGARLVSAVGLIGVASAPNSAK